MFLLRFVILVASTMCSFQCMGKYTKLGPNPAEVRGSGKEPTRNGCLVFTNWAPISLRVLEVKRAPDLKKTGTRFLNVYIFLKPFPIIFTVSKTGKHFRGARVPVFSIPSDPPDHFLPPSRYVVLFFILCFIYFHYFS